MEEKGSCKLFFFCFGSIFTVDLFCLPSLLNNIPLLLMRILVVNNREVTKNERYQGMVWKA